MTTSEIITLIANKTRHSNGDISFHRIGSELCHIARKGCFDRSELNGCDRYITSSVITELRLVIPMTSGEDYGHHRDKTYRHIAQRVMAYYGF